MTIPADIEHPDRILAGLTARQLAIMIPAIAAVWLVFLATHTLVPLPVFAALAIPILGTAAALALVQRDGIGLDRLALHALTYAHQPRRLVPAPDGVPALPAWAVPTGHAAATADATTARQQPDAGLALPAPLNLPARAIRSDGAINLGADGVAVIVACSTLSFALRTPGEQAALVGAFGGWLNSLSGPVQILVHAAPINLAPAITALRENATGLPHPALEEAALEHAAYLAELAATRDLLARRVLIVIREPYGPAASTTGTPSGGRGRDAGAAATRALRRAEQATRALAAAGITATVLAENQAAAALATAADPTAPPIDTTGAAAPAEPITGTTGAGVAR